MITTKDALNALYNNILNVYNEWTKSMVTGKFTWSVKKQCNYTFGPVLGLYMDKNKQLIDILNDSYFDEDILSEVLPAITRKVSALKKISEKDIMTELNIISYEKELLLIENGYINDWLDQYFIPCIRNINFELDENHIRGLCFIMYGYENYEYSITNIYCKDIANLKKVYQGVLNKYSELYTYKMIEITAECEMLAIDPPRFYDSRIDKTFLLSYVSRELLSIFIDLGKKKLYKKLSLRVSNAITKIFDGKCELQNLSEAVQIGKIFSTQNISNIPLTKLYSTKYEDCLWVKSSKHDITFEELCENEDTFNDSIVTQVIHLEYKQDKGDIVITHIDHEFIFYNKEDYEKRKSKAETKGKEQPRLKSFKIDEARIPLSLPIQRSINVYSNRTNDTMRKNETVPSLIYILKSYLKHHDLIDEYFANL